MSLVSIVFINGIFFCRQSRVWAPKALVNDVTTNFRHDSKNGDIRSQFWETHFPSMIIGMQFMRKLLIRTVNRFHWTPIGDICKISHIWPFQGLLVQLVPFSSNCTNDILKFGTTGKTLNAPTILFQHAPPLSTWLGFRHFYIAVHLII